MKSRLLCRFLLCVLCVLGSGSLGAGEAPPAPPPGPGDSARDVLREKTVYIPYDKLQAIFEKEGRGIFLPYEEFLKLWQAAQPKPPEPPPDVPPAPAVVRGGLYVGTVTGDVARFSVTFDIDALKKGWSDVALPFKGVALETVELSSPDALVAAKDGGYSILLPAPGRYQAKLQFSVRVVQEPGKKTVAFGIPPVAVSRLEMTIPEEAARIDLRPALAVTQTTAAEKSTKVLAFLGNSPEVSLSWMPPAGRAAEGGAILLAEQSIRAALGERMLKVSTVIAFQVLRGEVDTLRVRTPEGMRLIAVKGETVREWALENDVLVVKLHAALKDAAARPGAEAPPEGASLARLALSFEKILQETPPTLTVAFPKAEGVIRESGWVVFSHETGLGVRVQSTAGLSQLDRDEVPEALRGDLGLGFRYLAQPVSLALQVEKITPVIRSQATSVVILGTQEDAWVGWIDYSIAKAGVFRLEFRVPVRWSVATVGDPQAVEDFQATDEGGQRTVAVNLKTKALGNFRLPFRLTAQGSAVAGEAVFAPPAVLRCEQDRGLLGVSAPKAISLGTIEREKMNSADVDELFRSGVMGQVGAEAGIPLAYGYREQPASVKVRLEAKKTEVNALAQHLVEISDGGIKLTHILDYEILYAAVDRLTFTAPSDLDGVLKVEAKEKKEVRMGASVQRRTEWEVILQAPALGGVSVTVSHEVELKALDAGKPFPYALPILKAGALRSTGFVALRKEGNLEITPKAAAMESIDAGDLPDKLRRAQIYGAYRYFQADPSLDLTLTRYEYQPLASTIVSLLRLKSVLSEERTLKTQAVLLVQNTDRQYLELGLAPEAKILSLVVAGKPQQPRKRKDGTGTLIQIPPSAGPAGTFPVVLVYEEPLKGGAMGSLGGVSLGSPEVLDGVPVAKIELTLFLPPDFVYLGWSGNLKRQVPGATGLWPRFKALIEKALEVTPAAAPVQQRSQQKEDPQAVGLSLDLDNLMKICISEDFETLAPVGHLGFTFVGRRLFGFLDFLAFALACGVGLLMLRRKASTKLTTAAVLVFLPLVLVWFTQGAAAEIAVSLLAGSILALILIAARAGVSKAREYRAARLSLAPDPYLEEAAAPPAKGKEPPPASGTKGPEAAKPPQEPPASSAAQGPKTGGGK